MIPLGLKRRKEKNYMMIIIKEVLQEKNIPLLISYLKSENLIHKKMKWINSL